VVDAGALGHQQEVCRRRCRRRRMRFLLGGTADGRQRWFAPRAPRVVGSVSPSGRHTSGTSVSAMSMAAAWLRRREARPFGGGRSSGRDRGADPSGCVRPGRPGKDCTIGLAMVAWRASRRASTWQQGVSELHPSGGRSWQLTRAVEPGLHSEQAGGAVTLRGTDPHRGVDTPRWSGEGTGPAAPSGAAQRRPRPGHPVNGAEHQGGNGHGDVVRLSTSGILRRV
jgi:hypothetical protein